MNTNELKQSIKAVIPPRLDDFRKKVMKRLDYEFADFILSSAIEYSRHVSGDAKSFERRLKYHIKNSYNNCNEIIEDVLTAFMPEYEKNLYQYYKNQEYLIFYRFLCYPYRCDMSCYFNPYENALSRFQSNDILDYGSGIPYGLIHSLLGNSKSIKSITLVDLDLIHVDFVQFLINKIAPGIKLTVRKLKDANSFPELEEKYNFFFGKDVFEHLSDPLKSLSELMTYSKPEVICYFDFQDKGAKIHQHVVPQINFLSAEMNKMGFHTGKTIYGLTEFSRHCSL